VDVIERAIFFEPNKKRCGKVHKGVHSHWMSNWAKSQSYKVTFNGTSKICTTALLLKARDQGICEIAQQLTITIG
jgi:hypothetical protein